MVELFVGDVRSCINHLERNYVLAIGLVSVVWIRNDVAQHNLDIGLWLLKRLKFPHEDGPVFVLLSDLINLLLHTDSLA